MSDVFTTLSDVIETRFDEAVAGLHEQASYPELTSDFVLLRCGYVGRRLAGLSHAEQNELEKIKGYDLTTKIAALSRIEAKLTWLYMQGVAKGLVGCPHRWRAWLAKRYRKGDQVIAMMIEDLPWTRLALIRQVAEYSLSLGQLESCCSDTDIPSAIADLRANVERLIGSTR